MKKVVLSLAVLFSVAMVACSNKDAKVADSDTVKTEEVADTNKVEEEATDSNVADSAAETEAPAETPAAE